MSDRRCQVFQPAGLNPSSTSLPRALPLSIAAWTRFRLASTLRLKLKHVSVPIEKERVVIERVTPADAGRAVEPGTVNFGGGEVARIETYEETADIHKEAFVREEVKVKKVVDKETVEAQETLRREELDIDSQGRPVIDRSEQI